MNSIDKERVTAYLLYGQCLWFLLIVSLWLFVVFGAGFDINYTAGELLDHSLAWGETGRLYGELGEPPLRVLNYPPLFFLAVRVIHEAGISVLFAGRTLNLIAFILGAWILYRWLNDEGQWPLGSFGVTALLAGSFPVMYSLGQFHLQMSAVALSLGGMYLIRDPKRWSVVAGGGALMALACFVKQTQVVSCLIALAWLLVYHRRFSLSFILSLLIVGGAGSLLLQFFFDYEVWRQLITYTVGRYSLSQLILQGGSFLLPWLIFFVTGLILGIKRLRDGKDLRWWYFLGSSLWLLSSARRGSSALYFIEWTFATLLWIGPWLMQTLRRPEFFSGIRKIIGVVILFQIAVADLTTASLLSVNISILQHRKKDYAAICEILPGKSGIILTGEPGLARFCGRIPGHHPFIMTSLARQGLWDENPLVEKILQGYFPAIVIAFSPKQIPRGVHGERWTENMIQAMREGYRVKARAGPWYLLLPKGT